MAATVTVGGSTSGPFATVVRRCARRRTCRSCSSCPADVLLNPSFPADEWDALEDAHAHRPDSAAHAARRSCRRSGSRRSIFGDHPAGRVSATPETLDAITRDAMVEFHRTRFVPDHALIAFAGDISLAEARKMVEAKLAAWKKAGAPKPATTQPPAPGPAKVYLVAPPELGADEPHGRHAVDGPDRSRLRAADRRQPRARRHDGPALPPSARREGLHLRHRQRVLGDRHPRPVVGVDAACARRSPSRR